MIFMTNPAVSENTSQLKIDKAEFNSDSHRFYLRKSDSNLVKKSLSNRQTLSLRRQFALEEVGPVIKGSLVDKIWIADLSTRPRLQRGNWEKVSIKFIIEVHANGEITA